MDERGNIDDRVYAALIDEYGEDKIFAKDIVPKDGQPNDRHRTVDIWNYDDRSYFRCRTRTASEISTWLNESASEENEKSTDEKDEGKSKHESENKKAKSVKLASNGLRLVICRPRSKNEFITPFGLPSEVFKTMRVKWGLPPLFIRASKDRIPSAVYQEIKASKRCLVVRSNPRWPWEYCLTLVQCEKGMTYGVLAGLDLEEIESLVKALELYRDFARSFPLLPYLLLDFGSKSLAKAVQERFQTHVRVCRTTNAHNINGLEPMPPLMTTVEDPLIFNITSILDDASEFQFRCKAQSQNLGEVIKILGHDEVKEVSHQALDAPFFGRELIFLQQYLCGIQAKITRIEQGAQAQAQAARFILDRRAIAESNKIAESSRQIAERSEQIAERSEQIAERSEQTAERSGQIAEQSARIAEQSARIADLALKDSMDIRAISWVTFLFLPGTFAATFFSTSFFRFQPKTDSQKASGWIWIYFVVTVVLLGLVFVLRCYMRKRNEARSLSQP